MQIREISVESIAEALEKLCIEACCVLGNDAIEALEEAHLRETSLFGRDILAQLLTNARLARTSMRPCCQDTGMAVVFAEVGQDVHIAGGLFQDAVDEGVRRAYGKANLRKSVLSALERVNTGDNTPAILHTRLVEGDKIKLSVAPKGFGSENMSRLKMLKPSDGIEGIVHFVVETVQEAGANPCPPVVVGVGIGGTMEKAALLAKEQLLRNVNEPSPIPRLAQLEREIKEAINDLGIGPMGLGGIVTALAVHIGEFPTHLAGLPVAVNMQCHAARHKTIEL
jgi:fumarate hydratase subunit alpha